MKVQHMLPQYHLLESSARGVILAVEEWSDLMPPMPGGIWVKPLLESVREREQGAREINGHLMIDIKTRQVGGELVHRTEREIREMVGDLGIRCQFLRLHGLCCAAASSVIESWQPIRLQNANPWSDGESPIKDACDWAIGSKCRDDTYLIGSRLYLTYPSQAADIDIAISMRPSDAAACRRRIAMNRLSNPGIFRHDAGYLFPFRLGTSAGTADLFPCIDDRACVSHPLQNCLAWEECGDSPYARRVRVESVDASYYATPALQVDEAPHDVIVMSNAFRGAFLPGDILQVRCVDVKVATLRGSRTVAVVADPWLDLAEWQRLFCMSREERWLDLRVN